MTRTWIWLLSMGITNGQVCYKLLYHIIRKHDISFCRKGWPIIAIVSFSMQFFRLGENNSISRVRLVGLSQADFFITLNSPNQQVKDEI